MIGGGSASTPSGYVRRGLAVENLAHLSRERFRRERLSQERTLQVGDAVRLEDVVGVPGHEEELRGMVGVAELFDERSAAHSGHDDVREDEVDFDWVRGHEA